MQQPRTPAAVAAEVKMSARTVARWCTAGKIATVGKLDGPNGAWLIGPEGVKQAHRLAELARQYELAHRGAA